MKVPLYALHDEGYIRLIEDNVTFRVDNVSLEENTLNFTYYIIENPFQMDTNSEEFKQKIFNVLVDHIEHGITETDSPETNK